jgi:hypothetical protein
MPKKKHLTICNQVVNHILLEYDEIQVSYIIGRYKLK